MSSADFRTLASAQEATIETRAEGRVYRTIIWVAPGADALYVRSFLGDAGRWYQRALVDPYVALVVGKTRLTFRARPAADAASIQEASAGFRSKYEKGRSLDAMLRPEVLHSTMRLEPDSRD